MDHSRDIFAHARAHWSIIPVGADKKPACGSWKPFQSRRPTADEVDGWAAREPAGWAVITGPASGLFILDFDGKDGAATMARLGVEPHVRTGSGGHHLYCTLPDWKVPTLNSKVKQALQALWPGLDSRGTGGYAVFIGRNKAGAYTWLREPDDLMRWEDLPEDLTTFLRRAGEQLSSSALPKAAGAAAAPPWSDDDPGPGGETPKKFDSKPKAPPVQPEHQVIQGRRHGYLLSVGAALRAKGLERDEIAAALQGLNRRRCQPPKLAREVEAIVDWIMDKPAGFSSSDIEAPAPPVLVVTPDGWPPPEKLEALRSVHAKFDLAWRRARTDFKDQREETYEYSLASIATKVGWSDQEICDLLIAHRRTHGEDPRGEEHYGRILAAIQKSERIEEDQERLRQIYEHAQANRGEPFRDQEIRREILETVSNLFEFHITRITKLNSDKPIYRLDSEHGTIELGDVTGLIDAAKFRAKVATLSQKLIPRFKAENWDPIAKNLLAICDLIEPASEETRAGLGEAWVSEYLAQQEICESIADAVQAKQPFTHHGRLHLFSRSLAKWVKVTDTGFNGADVTTTLRCMGALPVTLGERRGDSTYTCKAWVLPGDPATWTKPSNLPPGPPPGPAQNRKDHQDHDSADSAFDRKQRAYA